MAADNKASSCPAAHLVVRSGGLQRLSFADAAETVNHRKAIVSDVNSEVPAAPA